MKIENYVVAMNAQYYNLKQDISAVEISQNSEDFSSDDTLHVEKIDSSLDKTKVDERELSVALSKAVLKSISDEENRFIRDRIDSIHVYTESQAVNFEVKAYVKTDAKELELSLNVSLSRSFTQRTDISVESLRELKDPLVISFNGNLPTLSSKTFNFDIDSDGKNNQISQLNSNSAFLVLDKNSNGVVDNGGELFGAQSGDGFADLSQYDEDKNGWIDENDAIFDRLQIWRKSDTQDELIGIGEVGIGAIFLGNADTPFSLRSDSNESLGEIRSSGFFLYENGEAGVISQIDMAVSSETTEALKNLESVKENLALFKIPTIYDEQESGESSGDSKIDKLLSSIKELESKLVSANDEKRVLLQAEIGALFAQVMAILEQEIST